MRFGYTDLFFAFLLAAAVYFFIKYPLSRKYTLPAWIDPSIGFSLALVSLIYIYFVHLSVNLVPESDYAPCGRLSKQMLCYNLSQDTCMVGWHSSSGSCKDELAELRKQRPTALMGAFHETCIGKNFDKVMHYNRRNLSHPDCQAYFSKIDKND